MNIYFIYLNVFIFTNTCFSLFFEKKTGHTIPNQISDKSIFITSENLKKLAICLVNCARIEKCEYVSINGNQCILYSFYSRYLIVKSDNETIYKKVISKNLTDLKHYWPIYDSNVIDIVSANNLYSPVNNYFCVDRAGINNSAIQLFNGYYRIPSGYYFSTNFTIIIWVKPYNGNSKYTIFDFGCGKGDNNFVFMLLGDQKVANATIFDGFNPFFFNDWNLGLSLGYWNHIAILNQEGYFSLCLNGSKYFKNYANLNYVNRTSNYLGGNNWNENFTGEIDDFKIYHRVLTEDEILNDFKFVL